jgi:hypothetical protein
VFSANARLFGSCRTNDQDTKTLHSNDTLVNLFRDYEAYLGTEMAVAVAMALQSQR